MEKFADLSGESASFIDLAIRDDVKFFKIKFSAMNHDFDKLINYKHKDVWQNPLLHIMIKNGQINHYLKCNHRVKYENSIMDWIKAYVNEESHRSRFGSELAFPEFFTAISNGKNETMNGDELLRVILSQIFELFGSNKRKLEKLLNLSEVHTTELSWGLNTKCYKFLPELLASKHNFVKSVNLILNNELLTDKEKYSFINPKDLDEVYRNNANTPLTFISSFRNGTFTLDHALQIYQYFSRDKNKFSPLLTRKYFGLKQIVGSENRAAVKILDMVFDSPFFNHQVTST